MKRLLLIALVLVAFVPSAHAATPITPGCNLSYHAGATSSWYQAAADLGCKLVRFDSQGIASDQAVLDRLDARGMKGLPILHDTSAVFVADWLTALKTHPGFAGILSLYNEPYGNWSTPHYANGGDYYRAVRDAIHIARAAGVRVILDAALSNNDGALWNQHMWDAAAAVGDDIDQLIYGLDVHPYTTAGDPMSTTSNGLRYQLNLYNQFLDAHGSSMVLWLTEFGCASGGGGFNDCGSEEGQHYWYARFVWALMHDTTTYARKVRVALQFSPLDIPNQPGEQAHFGLINGDQSTGTKKPAWWNWFNYERDQTAAGATTDFKLACPTF